MWFRCSTRWLHTVSGSIQVCHLAFLHIVRPVCVAEATARLRCQWGTEQEWVRLEQLWYATYAGAAQVE